MTAAAVAGGGRFVYSSCMRCLIERDYEFEAAHQLPRTPPGHKCRNMHGHSYKLTVRVEGEVNPETGWVMDFAEVDRHVGPLVAELDHRVLNEIGGLENPTSEILAAWLWERVKPHLGGLLEVEVGETRDARCIYRGG